MHKYLLVILLASTTFSFGQNYSTNPYSASGLGEEGSLGEAAFAAVGGIKSVIVDSNLVNFYNPSSYSFLAKGQPLMSVNIAGRLSRISQGDFSQSNGIGNLSHIALAFPIGKNFGFAFGITPFSRKGYNLSSTTFIYDDSVRYQYRGTGTTQRAFTGLSYKIINSKRTQFSVGGNLSYIFGAVGNERGVRFDDINTAGLDESTIHMKSIYYDFGTIAKTYIDSLKQHQLILGINLVPSQTLTAYRDYALYTIVPSYNRDSIIDTVAYNVNQKGTISYPSTFTIGGGYVFVPNNADGHLKNVYQLGVYAEYSRTSWSNYQENFASSTHASPIYKDASRMSVGVTFRPSFGPVSKASGGTFLNRVQYKAGFYSQSFGVQTAAGQLSENAVSIGFGIPMGIANTNSAVNLSVAGGNRTDGSSTGINEKFLNISFGLVLSPSKNDRWFRKYKLD